jgi:nitrogen regulatory protein P-II 1
MKKIEVMVSSSKLQEVHDAMRAVWTQGVTVIDVARFGRAAGGNAGEKGSMGRADPSQEVKIEVVVPDGFVRLVVDAVQISDGKVCLVDVEEAVGIRTGERGQHVV